MRILKYELEILDNQTIPIGSMSAKPLSVAEQSGRLMLWVETDIEHDPSGGGAINVEIIGTGNYAAAPSMPFIGTVVMSNGFVWHVYAERV